MRQSGTSEPAQGDGADTGFVDRLAHYDDPQAPLRAMVALEAGRMGSWRWDIAAGTVTGDPFVAELLNMDAASQPWAVEDVFASMHPDDLPRVQARVDEALAGADLYAVEFRDRVIDPETGEEGLRWLGARGRVTERDADGTPLEMIGVNWDATAQKTHEARLAMLAAEMDHRVKNAFAVIRSLINLGQRVPGDRKSFAVTLRAQVQAMADAHAISARLARSAEAPAVPVPVAEVIRTALAPWLSQDGRDPMESGANVDVDVAFDFAVAPQNVSAVAMLTYELATNATKYGPLGERGGRLAVTVTRDGGDGVIRWRETVDAPATAGTSATAGAASDAQRASATSGFGSTLIQHCVGTLRARMKREFTSGGLNFELRMPLD